jgi:hypothetical protein
VRNCARSVVDPSQLSACGVVVIPPAIVPVQASRQQLIVRWPLGQQESCEVSECALAAVWQSVDINGEIPANATTELCSPITSITMMAMSRRFMGKSLTGSRPPGKQLAKPCVEFAIRTSKSDTAYRLGRLQCSHLAAQGGLCGSKRAGGARQASLACMVIVLN